MSSVDDRIVNMQFNNKQFTQGAADSQKALEGLDRTIANTGKGGSGLDTMGGAVDGIKTKFSAMQVAGVAALATIVSKATTAGLSLIKSFTLDPLTQGFQEYQTNLNSIQTVMSNTGKSVNVVNGYMQKLNTYSDLTIYNFSEMAKNIGTFTAAGVDLKTATSSIQGIANLAALSGSSADQASTAMYQLSQAIAAGQVHMQDWNSVVNAGMGGSKFQNALVQTGEAMGTIDKSTVKITGSMHNVSIAGQAFRNSLTPPPGGVSWLTSGVLTKTLSLLDGRLSVSYYRAKGFNKVTAQHRVEVQKNLLADQNYTEAQIKGMVKTANAAYNAATVVKSLPQLMDVVKESIGSIFSNSFSVILGNFNQSKKLWTGVSKQIIGTHGVLTNMGNGIAHVLKGWAAAGGRNKVLKAFGNLFGALGKVFARLGRAWSDIFPPATKHTLLDLTNGFLNFTKTLDHHHAVLHNLMLIFKGVFATLHIGLTIIHGIAAAFGGLFAGLSKGSGKSSLGILSLIGTIAKVVINIDRWLSSGDRLVKSMRNIGEIAGTFLQPFATAIGTIIRDISKLARHGSISGLTDQFQSAGAVVQPFMNLMTKGLDKVESAITSINDPIGQMSAAIENLRGKVTAFLSSGISLSDIFSKVGSSAGNGVQIVSGIISGLIAGFKSAGPSILSSIGGIAMTIINGFKSALGIHSPAQTMIPIGVNVMMGIAKGVVAGFKFIIRAIDDVATWVHGAFSNLFSGMDALDWVALMNTVFSGALLLTMRNFIGNFSNIGSSISGAFGQLRGSLKALQTQLKAKALEAIAIAVGLLTVSLVGISLIDAKGLARGLGGMATMMALLVGTMKTLDSVGGSGLKTDLKLLAISEAIKQMSYAMIIMAAAVAILGHMKISTLSKGIGAMAIILGILVVAVAGISKLEGQFVAAAAGMVLMASALTLMANAVRLLGKMNMSTLAKGIGAIAVVLALMVGALTILAMNSKGVLGAAAAISIVSRAMIIMTAAIAILGHLDMKTLAKGLGAMAIGIALMTASLAILAAIGPETGVGAASMAIMAFALIEMAKAVQMFAGMSWADLGKGFAAVAVGLALLLLAAAGAEVVMPGLLALGITFGLLGAGMALAGVGMLAFATGFALLTATGVAGVGVLILAFQAFMALLPTLAVQFASSFVIFIETIAKAAPRLRKAFSEIFKSMLGVVTDAIPQIQKLLQALITAGINTIKKSVPQWIEMGLTIIDQFLKSMAKHVPDIANEAGDLVVNFIKALDDKINKIIDAGTNFLIHFLQGLGKNAVKIADATGQAILDTLNGLDKAVVKYQSKIEGVGLRIAGHIIDGFSGGLLGKLENAIQTAISHLSITIHGPGPLPDLHYGGGGGSDDPTDPPPTKSTTQKILDPNGLLSRGAGGKAHNKKKDPFEVAQAAVKAAMGLVSGADNPTNDPAIRKAQARVYKTSADAKAAAFKANQAKKASDEAARKQKQADAAADKAQALADKHKKNKADQAAAKKAKEEAKRAAELAKKRLHTSNHLGSAAEIAATKADNAQQNLADAVTFNEADLHGKGDIMTQKADDLAQRASDTLAKANAEAAKAKTLTGKAAKEMLAKAKADAKTAKDLAAQAKAAEAEASGYYAQEVNDRIKQIEDDTAADQKAKDDEAAYNAADDAGKVNILKNRIDAEKAAADTAKANAASLIAQAKAKAATDPAEAMKLLDQAEQAAQDAKDAADKADADQQTMEQLLTQPGDSTGDTPSNGILPSKSIMEDAAKAVDRYTASLQQAQELAGQTQQPIQYNQNIYSPVALSPTEVYRQSKNLISAPARTGPGLGGPQNKVIGP